MKYDYNICDAADEAVFYSQCAALEKHIPGLKDEQTLYDVDGSLIRIYAHVHGGLKIYCDTNVDAVYIKSSFDIDPFFPV